MSLNTFFASPDERSTNRRTINSGVERARQFRFGVRSTINSRCSSRPLASIPSMRKSSLPYASRMAGARCVTNTILESACCCAARNIPAIIRAPAPGSVMASSSSARMSLGWSLLTTLARSTNVVSSAPALCVPLDFART